MKRKASVVQHPAAAAAAARASRPATTPPGGGRVFVEGQIVRMMPDGNAILRLRDRREIPCRRAATIDRSWLCAALAVGPVDAEGTCDLEDGTGSIWCVFPGPEHDDVAPATARLVAAQRIELRCGKSSLSLEKDGSLQVRGRDIVTRGSRSARLSGGIVRIN